MFKKLKWLLPKEVSVTTITPPAPPLKKVRSIALVVDDEDDLRKTLRMVLESFGYFVRDFKECAEAIQYIEEPENLPSLDIVVSDLMMANQDGIDLLGAIRKKPWLDHVRFYLVAGADPSVFRDLLAPYRIEQIIEKPFDLEGIENIFRRAS